MDWVTGVIDAGNGMILATRPEDGLLSIVTWEAGQTYFDGSLYTAGGPRMLFIAGTGSGNNAPDYSPAGAYNLTAEGEIMFLNAVKYMLTPEPEGPSTEGLVAYYALEEDVLDGSGNGLDGTIIGDPVFVEGISGMALDFNGDDYVDCGNNEVLNSINDAMTVSAWVNIRSVTAAWMVMVNKGETAWRLGVNNQTSSVHYGFTGGDRGWLQANTATELLLGEWYHVAATYDTLVGAQVYLNGVVDATNSDLGGVSMNEMPLLLGENPEAAGRFFDGVLDEILIYNRALSADEVGALAGM
jgi:hypothetical protein